MPTKPIHIDGELRNADWLKPAGKRTSAAKQAPLASLTDAELIALALKELTRTTVTRGLTDQELIDLAMKEMGR